MQKWNVHCVLRGGRPGAFRRHDSFVRQFYVSTQRSEGRSSSSRPPTNNHMGSNKFDAVDARDLAAVPNPSPRPPGRSIGEGAPARRAPFDARGFGAQRPDSNEPRVLRTSSYSDAQRRDDQGPRILRRRDPSDSQYRGGSTSAQHNRNRNAPDRTGPGRSGPGRPGPKGEKGGTRAPRSGTSGGGDGGRDVGDKPSAEEIEYLSTRDNNSSYGDSIFESGTLQYTRANDVGTYYPADTSINTLQGMGPSLACGEWGMNETVGERLIQVDRQLEEYDQRIEKLARQWEEGAYCQFRNQREKEDTLKTVERNLAGQGDNAKLDEEKQKENMALMDRRMAEERARLATRLLKGDYYIGPLGKGPTAELLERYTRKNETYMPKDSQALAGKVRTLLPLGQTTTPVDTAKG